MKAQSTYRDFVEALACLVGLLGVALCLQIGVLQTATEQQEEVRSSAHDGLLFKDALYRQSLQAGEGQQGLRKYPLAQTLLLLLSLQQAQQHYNSWFAASLFFSFSKDMPVSYRNLRI